MVAATAVCSAAAVHLHADPSAAAAAGRHSTPVAAPTDAVGSRRVTAPPTAPAIGRREPTAGKLASPARPSNPPPTAAVAVTDCPWLASAMARHLSPSALAGLTVARMTLAEKLGELVLRQVGPYENVDSGVPRLCIPSLTLQDGPAGLAFGDTGVTAFPAPLAVAASFDASLARAIGQAEGSEARGQGIDVVQGPDLNLARVPESGRVFESFGEDPTLTSALGVATIDGIQSTGVMAQAKHLVAYNQETNRRWLDAVVPARALHELYLTPFRAAVEQAHVSSIMCAYPRLDGTFQCQDPALEQILARWGFQGFVRSDLGAVHDPVAALTSGTDLLKPGSVAALAQAVASRRLALATVDADVARMLTEMFSHGLIGHRAAGTPGTVVDTPAHRQLALRAAEQAAVLLQNRGHLLPLHTGTVHSLAVIGADASSTPVIAGGGSSLVTPPLVSTPLAALRSRAGTTTTVVSAGGASSTGPLPDVPASWLTPASGSGHGLTFTIRHATPGGAILRRVDPVPSATITPDPADLRPAPDTTVPEPGGSDWSTTTVGTRVELPRAWGPTVATWSGTLTPAHSGLYSFHAQGTGTVSLTLGGAAALPPGSRVGTWTQAVSLRAGHPYHLDLVWNPSGGGHRLGAFRLGMTFDSPAIAQAAAAARASQVAVVFAAAPSTEGADRPSLALPGDQNALIDAVAAANPRTVVVLNTGGAVLMPWLDRVAAVVEAWYPGEEDGAAIAAVLYGAVDPAGRLPVTFPAAAGGTGITSRAQWPGNGLTSTYTEDLQMGYRFVNATGTRPLFPFGYGLSYTRFALRSITVGRQPDGAVTVHCTVTDTGPLAGGDVVQAYLTFPAAAGEPPRQLVAFAPVTLTPGASTGVTLHVPARAFESYLHGRWTTVGGTYTLGVGDSSASLALSTSLVR